jgi:hypothetical protein
VRWIILPRYQAGFLTNYLIYPGLALAFLPPSPLLHNPARSFISRTILHQPVQVPPSNLDPSNAFAHSLALAGTFSFGIGVAYLHAFYRGYEEWLYMSIPARLGVSVFGLLVGVLFPKKMTPLMLSVCVWDGFWPAAIAVAMGDVSGKGPEGYRRRMKEL